MEQMVLRAQEQPCRCWRGNWPSGVYCFPIFPPVLCVLLLMFSKLWELSQNFSTYNYTREFSLPLCPLELSSRCLIWWLTMLWSCSAQCPLLPPSAGVQALHTSLQRCLTKGFLGRLPSYCGEEGGNVLYHQNLQKPQKMENLSFLGQSAGSFMWSQVLSTQEMCRFTILDLLWDMKKIYTNSILVNSLESEVTHAIYPAIWDL